jgi:hypothetical protein
MRDVNGDGRRDLAVANASSNSVTILLGNGSGGFAPAAGSPVAVGANPEFVAIADLNGDGRADLSVANGGANTVTLLLGDGSGGFHEAVGSPVPVGNNPVPVAPVDVNGDGKLDLAVANFSSNNVTVLTNGTASAPGGTACDDGNACTTGDTCIGLSCFGTPGAAPAEADNGVRVARAGSLATITWNLAAGATSSDLLRGQVSALPVGPGFGDEVCLADNAPALSVLDSEPPASGTAFWYLVRGVNVCGTGSYGSQGLHGTPSTPRTSSTCP